MIRDPCFGRWLWNRSPIAALAEAAPALPVFMILEGQALCGPITGEVSVDSFNKPSNFLTACMEYAEQSVPTGRQLQMALLGHFRVFTS